MSDVRTAEMAQLMALPGFRKFLFSLIQRAGVLDYAPFSTNGSDGRDLAYYEGRRSLGLDILRDADAAQPAPMRHPNSIMTLMTVLREEAQTTEQEKPRGRPSRYDDDDGTDGSADDRAG